MLRFLLLFLLLLTTAFGSPSEALLRVLDRFGICHDGSWESIQRETEKAWLHGRETELWELKPIENISAEEAYALFTPLGMTEPIFPSCRSYDYAVLLGATESIVLRRILFLKEQNVCFEQLVVLTGDRPLAEFERSGAKNETEMIKALFAELDLPEEWREKIVFIDTPRPEGMRRPHTHHTFEYWNPAPGTALILSNQPFVYRQGAIACNYLPCVDPVGPGFTVEELKGRIQILLAELAQWIKIEYENGRIDCPSPLTQPLPVIPLR